MSGQVKVTVLGSGTSTGVPVIGCACAVCSSHDPHDKRYRASIMLTLPAGDHVVVDTGPEFRLQMLRAGVKRLSHVLYTHTHADHCHGFDDLRAYYFHQKTPVTCHVPREYEADVRRRFAYAFEDTGYIGTKPQVLLTPFDEEPFQVLGLTVEPAMLPHGNVRTAAFRIGRFAYATDFKAFPESLVARWRGKVDVMIASGVQFEPHPTHSNIPETLALFEKLQVKQGIISHLNHHVSHARDAAALPPGRAFAHDGMAIDVRI